MNLMLCIQERKLNMEKQISLFLEFIKNDKKLSDNTFESYKRDIVQFQNYLNKNDINYLKIQEEDIKDYLIYLKDINKKPTTISRHLASIRLFYQYLLKNKKIKRDPTKTIQLPRIEKKVPTILSSQEVSLLLEQPKRSRFKRN